MLEAHQKRIVQYARKVECPRRMKRAMFETHQHCSSRDATKVQCSKKTQSAMSKAHESRKVPSVQALQCPRRTLSATREENQKLNVQYARKTQCPRRKTNTLQTRPSTGGISPVRADKFPALQETRKKINPHKQKTNICQPALAQRCLPARTGYHPLSGRGQTRAPLTGMPIVRGGED